MFLLCLPLIMSESKKKKKLFGSLFGSYLYFVIKSFSCWSVLSADHFFMSHLLPLTSQTKNIKRRFIEDIAQTSLLIELALTGLKVNSVNFVIAFYDLFSTLALLKGLCFVRYHLGFLYLDCIMYDWIEIYSWKTGKTCYKKLVCFSDDLLLMTTPPTFQSVVETPSVAPGVVISGPSPDQELDKIFACSPQTSEQDSNVSVPLI